MSGDPPAAHLCPTCKKSELRLYQIDLETAIFLCTNTSCEYPSAGDGQNPSVRIVERSVNRLLGKGTFKKSIYKKWFQREFGDCWRAENNDTASTTTTTAAKGAKPESKQAKPNRAKIEANSTDPQLPKSTTQFTPQFDPVNNAGLDLVTTGTGDLSLFFDEELLDSSVSNVDASVIEELDEFFKSIF